jgi:hypothetical protein
VSRVDPRPFSTSDRGPVCATSYTRFEKGASCPLLAPFVYCDVVEVRDSLLSRNNYFFVSVSTIFCAVSSCFCRVGSSSVSSFLSLGSTVASRASVTSAMSLL